MLEQVSNLKKIGLTPPLASFALTILLISALTPIVYAPPKPPATSSTIQFLGYHQNPDLTVDFCYRITAGSSKVTKWEITSPCFTKASFVDSDPKGELNPAKHRIHFEEKIEPGQSQDFCITLKIDYYALVIGPLPYTIYYPPDKKDGTVNGPTTPGFEIAETPFGTLGAVIPLIVALGLIVATKKNIIKLPLGR